MILERFDDYYGGSPEIPPVQVAPLKYLVIKAVPIKTEQIAMLKKGECDIISHVPPEAIRILQTTPGIKIFGCPATRSYFAEMNSIKPPFNDRRIRLAMNYAVDMQAVIDHILKGHAKVLPTIMLRDLCKTPPFAQFRRQAQILTLEILNVFLWLKFSPSLDLNKIEHFSKVSLPNAFAFNKTAIVNIKA